MTTDLRQVVLDALDELYCPADAEDLAAYAAAFPGTPLDQGDLEALQDQERYGYLAGERRGVWICPAIVDHPGFPADHRLLTRSDWQLENRVLGRCSEAVRQLFGGTPEALARAQPAWPPRPDAVEPTPGSPGSIRLTPKALISRAARCMHARQRERFRIHHPSAHCGYVG
jgi:hypothetical protein